MSTYATPIPGAAIYAQIEALANKAYANTLAELNQKRSATLLQYGYLGDVDKKKGVVRNVRVDPYNPYGMLQSMLRNQAYEDRDAQWNNEERGLQGGLANQAYSQLHYSHGGQSAQLGQTFNNTLADYQYAQQQAAYQRDMALYQAELAAAQAAIGSQGFSPADPGGGGGGTGGGSPTGTGGGTGPYTTGQPGVFARPSASVAPITGSTAIGTGYTYSNVPHPVYNSAYMAALANAKAGAGPLGGF